MRAGCHGWMAAALPGLLAELHTAAQTLTGRDQKRARELVVKAALCGRSTLVTYLNSLLATPTDRVMRRRAALRTLLILGGCNGLGFLFGFGLAELHYIGNLILTILSNGIAIMTIGMLFMFMKSFGLHDLRSRMALSGLRRRSVGGSGVRHWCTAPALVDRSATGSGDRARGERLPGQGRIAHPELSP